jgi:mannose-6-phosphate isomerase-like protein (cupin superfamily)
MRRLVTGTNSDGLSCIVEESEVVTGPVEGVDKLQMAGLWATQANPPAAGPQQTGLFTDVRLVPGLLRWIVVDHEPHTGPSTASRMHHSDTIDLIVVLEGTTRLVLQNDARDLEPGDCIVMTGVDHAFEAGPDGCRVLSVAVGTPPRG